MSGTVNLVAGGDGSYLEAEVREKHAQLEEVDRELSSKEQQLREGESCHAHHLTRDLDLHLVLVFSILATGNLQA